MGALTFNRALLIFLAENINTTEFPTHKNLFSETLKNPIEKTPEA